ncbi:MAG: phosphodiester glycosidase family protein [Oscillospiraceae bacterium]|nr:phosphodiester glycosidase family protein [Oscillospiraceae bacterium]
MALPKVIILDVLLLAVILLGFAFFHHVLPAMISEYERQQALLNTTPSEPPVSEPTVPVTDGPTDPTEEEQTEPPTEDPRTAWQIKFADHFTEEVVATENSYTSPEISISLETITAGEGRSQITYHVADIYVASLENFTTVTANGEMRYFGTQDAQEMVEESNAIIAISGDFLTYQKAGFLMRNGEIYQESTNNVSICVLFADGTMETYDKKQYNIEEIKSRGAVQVWSFGPVLLDENGKVRENYDVSQAVSYPNPRSAIGYYEPGHYCFVVVDGRQEGYSAGMTIPALAQVFQDLGCTSAYNLDGGGSAVMFFGGQRYSRQSNGGDRALGDMLVIRASGNTEQEAAQ